MTDIAKQILDSVILPNVSLKSSDFFGYVNVVKNKIINYFQSSTVQIAPVFISNLLKEIENNTFTSDKRKKYASAVCLTSLINIFPFDSYISQYKHILDKLLEPGYKPIVETGAIVLGRVAKLTGYFRDALIVEYIENNKKRMTTSKNPEELYASATILYELSKYAPEHFYSLGSELTKFLSLVMNIKYSVICDIISDLIQALYSSESASLGADLLIQMHIFLVDIIIFNLGREDCYIYGNLQVLLTLIPFKPYITKDMCQKTILPLCIPFLHGKDKDLFILTLNIICKFRIHSKIDLDESIVFKLAHALMEYSTINKSFTDSLFSNFIQAFSEKFLDISIFTDRFHILSLINDVYTRLNTSFDLCTSLIFHLSSTVDIRSILDYTITIIDKSVIALPIHTIVDGLNNNHPNWVRNFSYFKYQLMQIIREDLSNRTTRSDKITYDLMALNKIRDITLNDAMEFNSLIVKLTKHEDSTVREMVANSSISLFNKFPDMIPLNTMLRLVKFALDDPVLSVRIKTLKAFSENTFKYICQPDVFKVFCNFVFDENTDVRKWAFYIIRSLPVYSRHIVRNVLIKTIKQTTGNFDVIAIQTTPAWKIMPNLIASAEPILALYAEALYDKFIVMLQQRFNGNNKKDKTLLHVETSVMLPIDESLIKSISRLHIICPDIVPLEPIIEIFCNILKQPVHPSTKEKTLKSLKNLTRSGVAIDRIPELLPSLLEVIKNNENTKLVIKSLKVIGVIGYTELVHTHKKRPFVFKSGLNKRVQFNRFFVDIYFKYLVDMFDRLNIESTRDSVAKAISYLFTYSNSQIPQFIQFLEKYLKFIKGSNSEKLHSYISYLSNMIEYSKHLIFNYIDKIYESLEDHWKCKFTKEVSIVFSTLVISTQGRCDSILHVIVSATFILVRTKEDIEDSIHDVFNLLRVIAQYSFNYITPVLTGVIEIINSASSVNYLQKQALDTIEFIINFCPIDNIKSVINRSLLTVSKRVQSRWSDRARNLLFQLATVQDDAQKIKYNFLETLDEPHVDFDVKLFKFKLSLVVPSAGDGTDKEKLNLWFSDLFDFMIKESPSFAVRTMAFLPTPPKFAFQFSFLSIWVTMIDEDKSDVVKLLMQIYREKKLPVNVFKKFINLAELCYLCEINIDLDDESIINACIENNYYDKALFFLSHRFNFNNKIKPTQHEIQLLVRLNTIIGRKIEANSLAQKNHNIIDYKAWMELRDWKRALESTKDLKLTRELYKDKVIIYSHIHNWDEIYNMKDMFNGQTVPIKSATGKFFALASIYKGDIDEAKLFMNNTGGYTVEDCIYNAIILIMDKQPNLANNFVHLGWRYLASNICAAKNNNKTLIQNNLFYAFQLHELSDVLDVIIKKKDESSFNYTWRERLKYIKNNTDYLTQLFKIRKLVPGVMNLEDYGLFILKSHKNSSFDDKVSLVNIFFDKESIASKFCLLKAKGEKDIEKYKKLLESSSGGINVHIQNQIGKIILTESNAINDLKEGLYWLKKANKSFKKLANTLLLIVHLEDNESYVSDTVISLEKCIMYRNSEYAIYINQLLSLLIEFSDSYDTVSIIQGTFKKSMSSYYTHSLNTIISLINHQSKYVVDIVVSIITRMCAELPQVVGFKLLAFSSSNKDNYVYDNLLELLQSEHPIFYGQMELISKKMIKISTTIYDSWIAILRSIINFIRVSDFTNVRLEAQKLISTLSSFSSSRYELEFKNSISKKVRNFLKELTSITTSNNTEIQRIENIIKDIVKKQDSIQVIPLRSLDDELEKKQAWSLLMLGKNEKTNVHISRFFHSVQRLNNGLKITILGDNGKKYNYHLKTVSDNKLWTQAEDFMYIVDNITCHENIIHRSIVDFSRTVQLSEILKGHISIYDLIYLYKESVGERYDNEPLSISKFENQTHKKRLKKLIELSESKYIYALSKAIMVTSSSSFEYLQRTSRFSSTMGFLAGVSYIMGDVSSTPHDILYNKTTGAATYTNINCSGKSKLVPFRLTPMIVSSFGTTGVKGPYFTSFSETLNSIKKQRLSLAASIQFALGKEPYNQLQLPTHYTHPDKKIEPGESEIDDFYDRITCQFGDVKQRCDLLIKNASSLENLASMPAEFIPWW